MRIARRLALSVLVGLVVATTYGCQSQSTIPSNAHLENESVGEMSFTAREPGIVFILERDKNEKVFETRVNTGDEVVLKPDVNQILVAGNAAKHWTSLKPDHHYGIYFDPQH